MTVNVFLALICEVVIPLLVYIICCYVYTLSVALLAACLRGTLNWGRVGLHGGLKSWGVRISLLMHENPTGDKLTLHQKGNLHITSSSVYRMNYC